MARYQAGELTREAAADQLASADWDDTYVRASMQPGGDYDGSPFFEAESFASVVYSPSVWGQLDHEDYRAFQEAFVAWRWAKRPRDP